MNHLLEIEAVDAREIDDAGIARCRQAAGKYGRTMCRVAPRVRDEKIVSAPRRPSHLQHARIVAETFALDGGSGTRLHDGFIASSGPSGSFVSTFEIGLNGQLGRAVPAYTPLT